MSIIYEILSTNIYSSAGNGVEPTTIMLVALYCVITKIQVNWESLAMYNMTTCTKNMGGVKHFSKDVVSTIWSIISQHPLDCQFNRCLSSTIYCIIIPQTLAKLVQWLHGRSYPSPACWDHGARELIVPHGKACPRLWIDVSKHPRSVSPWGAHIGAYSYHSRH